MCSNLWGSEFGDAILRDCGGFDAVRTFAKFLFSCGKLTHTVKYFDQAEKEAWEQGEAQLPYERWLNASGDKGMLVRYVELQGGVNQE